MQEVIHEYIRERVTGKGKQVVGVMAGTVHKGMIVTGWAKTNLKEGDVYDKHFGLTLALDRARGIEPTPELPIQLTEQYRKLQIRCLRYFKQAKVLSTAGPFVAPIEKASDKEKVNRELDKLFKDIGTMLGTVELWGGGFGFGFMDGLETRDNETYVEFLRRMG